MAWGAASGWGAKSIWGRSEGWVVAGDAGAKVAFADDGIAVTSALAAGVLMGLAAGVGLLGGVAPGSMGAEVYGAMASGPLGFGGGTTGLRRLGAGAPRGVLPACAGCCDAKLI